MSSIYSPAEQITLPRQLVAKKTRTETNRTQANSYPLVLDKSHHSIRTKTDLLESESFECEWAYFKSIYWSVFTWARVRACMRVCVCVCVLCQWVSTGSVDQIS